jgi:hypothetical protein
MSRFEPISNPHRTPDPERLSEILDETLHEAIRLHLLGTVPATAIRNAGVPNIEDLQAEMQRRERERPQRVAP